MTDERLNLNAYYYGFEPTGVLAIDRVLAAVAAAGKGSHHTEDWGERYDDEPSLLERIQEAAEESAKLVKELENCPLRELAKWISKGPCFQVELFHGETSGFAVGCEDATDEDHCTCVAYGDGETLIDAAADAVKQLKERGEL